MAQGDPSRSLARGRAQAAFLTLLTIVAGSPSQLAAQAAAPRDHCGDCAAA
jgi:hypothetical protein